jgi:type I restriction enzyme S subunit
VRIGNLVGGSVLAAEGSAFLPRSFRERYERFQVNRGDLLIALSGATTGKVARFNLDSPALLNQRVGRFLVGGAPASFLDYLEALFQTTYIRNMMSMEMQGGGQPNLAPCEIESFAIPRPPRRLLDGFSRSVSMYREQARRQLIAKTDLDRLFRALLHRAFTGQLTTRWREAHMKELLAEMELETRNRNYAGGVR